VHGILLNGYTHWVITRFIRKNGRLPVKFCSW